MIRLEEIEFNWNDQTSSGCALNVRRNVTEAVNVPEWKRGASSSTAESSPVAYSLMDNSNSRIKIQCRLTRNASDPSFIEVRALQAQTSTNPWRPSFLPNPQQIWPGNYVFSSWLEYSSFLSYSSYYESWQASFVRESNVLGEVKAKSVAFGTSRSSGPEFFELINTALVTRGVGVSNVEWQWEYRRFAGDPWKPIDVTRHRVYTVLEVPTAPWTQQPYVVTNTQLPWTDVLEIACAWASGARSQAEAATAVTESFFQLGSGLISYGCPIQASPMYSNFFGERIFDCSAFLEMLSGSIGNGRFVNCSDCATVVSTFANALGCDLWQSIMGYPLAFETNPIEVIGSSVVQSPCGWGLGFSFHEVAWTENCTSEDDVYDGCLKVPAMPLETMTFPVYQLATGMRFGETGSGQYRDRLAAPSSRDLCFPRSETRIRRFVY